MKLFRNYQIGSKKEKLSTSLRLHHTLSGGALLEGLPFKLNTRPAAGTRGRLFPPIPPEVTRNTNQTTAKLNQPTEGS